MYLNIYKFLNISEVEGPGKRACIWVQGCSIRCKNCALPQTWSKERGQRISIDELAEKIKDINEIEGVTFTGGEPFDQAEPLFNLALKLKEVNLSIITFTGYKIEDIRNSKDKSWHDLLSVSDILIDSPYVYGKSDFSRPLVGSSNQRYHFLSNRYVERDLLLNPQRIEVRIQKDGIITVNGQLNPVYLDKIFNELI
jgi:anaerobic ribonucleoside-triphosphate reductase activating protein